MPLHCSLRKTHLPNLGYYVSNIAEQPAMAGGTTEIVTCRGLPAVPKTPLCLSPAWRLLLYYL